MIEKKGIWNWILGNKSCGCCDWSITEEAEKPACGCGFPAESDADVPTDGSGPSPQQPDV